MSRSGKSRRTSPRVKDRVWRLGGGRQRWAGGNGDISNSVDSKNKEKKETQQLNAMCVPGLHLFAKRAILGQMEKLSGV